MNRRQHLKALIAATPLALTAADESGKRSPIQLHLDLQVDPAKEKKLIATYRNTFSPAIRKQPGFVDARLMKLRAAMAGKAPENCTYRLLLSFQTEEQRQAWVKTDTHQQVWPKMEENLTGAKYIALLYDVV